jgi:hypothetical protein
LCVSDPDTGTDPSKKRYQVITDYPGKYQMKPGYDTEKPELIPKLSLITMGLRYYCVTHSHVPLMYTAATKIT